MAGTSLTRLGLQARAELRASVNGNGAHPERKALPKINGSTFFPQAYWGLGSYSTDAEATEATAYVVSYLCYAATRFRAANLAEAPLQVVRIGETEDDVQPVPGHPLQALLDDPSPDYEQAELVELTQSWCDLFGGAIWVKDRNRGGSIGRLMPMGANEFTVAPAGGRLYGRFELDVQSGERVRRAEDVVYFRPANPYHRTDPLSLVRVVCSWLNLSLQTQRSVDRLLRNAMMPGGVIATHQDWNPDEELLEEFKASIEAYHANGASAGKPFVALGGARFYPTSMPVKDMLPKELLHRCEAVVGSVFGVAPVVLGWEVGLENSPWSNMAEARRMTYEDTLEPLWKWHARKVTRQMLTPEEREAGLRVRFDLSAIRALQDDDVERSQVVERLADIWSINERRQYTGKEPADGEEYDEVPKKAPPPDMGARPGDPNGPGTDPSGTASDEGADPKAAALQLETKHERQLAWMRFDWATKAQESTWRWQIEDELAADLSATLTLVDRHLRDLPKRADPTLFDRFAQALEAAVSSSWVKRWLGRVDPLLKSTATAAIESLATEVGLGFDVLEPTILPWVRKHSADLVTQVTRTTKETIRGTVEAGIRDGLSVDDIARKLREDHAFSRARAKLIARTETTQATNGSKRQALSEYQVGHADARVLKTWLATHDEKVRPEHKELDGTEIGIDEHFANGLTEPGEPNCRCTLTYRIERE